MCVCVCVSQKVPEHAVLSVCLICWVLGRGALGLMAVLLDLTGEEMDTTCLAVTLNLFQRRQKMKQLHLDKISISFIIKNLTLHKCTTLKLFSPWEINHSIESKTTWISSLVYLEFHKKITDCNVYHYIVGIVIQSSKHCRGRKVVYFIFCVHRDGLLWYRKWYVTRLVEGSNLGLINV